MTAISVRGLRKSYGDFEAVKGISFEVPEGSFFAFLGPNGAGKSTTISIVCSLLGYDSGSVEVFGKDVTVLANDMKSFRAVVSTAVGPVFYSWVFGFGGKVSIKSPEDVKKSYAAMVKQAAEALTE